MPPKRKRGDVDADDQREKFQQRGDMGIFRSGTDWNLALTIKGDGERRLLLHRALLISRVGFFKHELAGADKVDESGKTAMTLESPGIRSVLLMLEFVYGKGMVEIIEYPSEKQPFIGDCILLYNLGHTFDIPDMVKYAINHLGMYLSRKLKEICQYPLLKTPGIPRDVMDDLEASIRYVEKAEDGKTVYAQKNHPRKMLIDFLVVGGDALMRDSTFRWNIGQDLLPAAFVRDVFLAQTEQSYQTPWMTRLMVRPESLDKDTRNRGRCISCRESVAREQQVVFNPWSHQGLQRKYTQFCCEDCANGMEEDDGTGVSWDIFDAVKDE